MVEKSNGGEGETYSTNGGRKAGNKKSLNRAENVKDLPSSDLRSLLLFSTTQSNLNETLYYHNSAKVSL